MNRKTSKRLISWVILITLISVALSSCSFIDQFTDKGKIKSTVNSYLSDIQSGVFTFDNFGSDYASDKAFSELKYLAEESEVIMKAGMKKITFELGDITADKGSKSGTCGITISAVDVPKVIEGFGGHKPDFDEMLEAVKAQGSVMSSHTITLSVIYDSADKMWKVKDSLPLVDIIAKPYTELTFFPDPTETVNILIAAANATDYLELDNNSEGITWPLPDDEAEKKMEEAANSKAVFEIVADPVITDNKAVVKIKVTAPDFQVIVDEFMIDVEFWATYTKPVLLDAINGVEDPNLSDGLDQMIIDEFLKRIEDPNAKTMSIETTMELKFDEESNSWFLTAWNFRSYMDVTLADDAELSQDIINQSGIMALDMLLEEGEISKSVYNQCIKGYQE